jgi:hypothetical protein
MLIIKEYEDEMQIHNQDIQNEGGFKSEMSANHIVVSKT